MSSTKGTAERLIEVYGEDSLKMLYKKYDYSISCTKDCKDLKNPCERCIFYENETCNKYYNLTTYLNKDGDLNNEK